MIVRISIKTPKGQARNTEAKIRYFILGTEKPIEMYASPEDDEIIWVMSTTMVKALRLTRNVARYGELVRMIFENKLFRKAIIPKLAEGQELELRNMLEHQTKIEIIKTATAEELVEANMTWWERTKKKYLSVSVHDEHSEQDSLHHKDSSSTQERNPEQCPDLEQQKKE